MQNPVPLSHPAPNLSGNYYPPAPGHHPQYQQNNNSQEPWGNPNHNVHGGCYPPQQLPHPPPSSNHYPQQQQQYHQPQPQPQPQPNVAGGPLVFHFFRTAPKKQLIRASDSDALLTLSLPHDKQPIITARRGDSAEGEVIGTATLHEFTTTRADMTLWTHRHTRWKKTYDSFTGLGKLSWEKDKDGLVLHGGKGKGEMLAKYTKIDDPKKSKGLLPGLGLGGLDSKKKSDDEAGPEARLEIFPSARGGEGFTREQMEEIVISCVVERERLVKAKKDFDVVDVIVDVVTGIAG